MAKEHGLMEHKGKTIPKEVKSLADRIRKDQPDKDDEYAYRTAWDVYRSYTPEGKQYPNKSPESGLKREGGGTGPLSKTSNAHFWEGFEKAAAPLRDLLAKSLGKARSIGEENVLNYRSMLSNLEKNRLTRLRPDRPAVLNYRNRSNPTYTPPGLLPA